MNDKTVNILWLSDNYVGKQKMKDLKRNYGDDLHIYDLEEEVDNVIKIVELAREKDIDFFEYEDDFGGEIA